MGQPVHPARRHQAAGAPHLPVARQDGVIRIRPDGHHPRPIHHQRLGAAHPPVFTEQGGILEQQSSFHDEAERSSRARVFYCASVDGRADTEPVRSLGLRPLEWAVLAFLGFVLVLRH